MSTVSELPRFFSVARAPPRAAPAQLYIMFRYSSLVGKRARRSRVVGKTMAKDTATTRTLRRALATIGSEEHLAAALDCSPLELMCWLSGEKPAPGEIFIA